jgi:hypothetical protein
MDIVIDKRPKDKLRNVYKISSYYMDGDADSYSDTNIIIPESELEDKSKKDEFKSLLLTLARCNHFYMDGKGGYDDYDDVEGYDTHFSKKDSCYSMEHVSAMDGISAFDGWDIVYYDENGEEFDVLVTFSEEEMESFVTADV